jgi:CheY-like chemotaxis protein
VTAARILVIEDNEESLELASYLLTAAGYSVLCARDGVEGVASALRERPNLVLCDLQMPRLDGYGVLEQLREHPHTRSIPVVAVTAQSMTGDRDRAIAAGFDGWQSKPIDPQAFVALIEAFLPEILHAAPPRHRGGT